MILPFLLFLILALIYSLRPIEGLGIHWSNKELKDYPNNDIKTFKSISTGNCMYHCIDTKGCVGIVMDHDSNVDGTCWLKNNMKDGSSNSGRWAYKLKM